MTNLANTGMQGVRAAIALNALSSFEYFANTVLGSLQSEELCTAVQDVVEDREDVLVRCTHPRRLAIALRAWLESRGASVLTIVELPRTEILEWLQLEEKDLEGCAISLDVYDSGVSITWL